MNITKKIVRRFQHTFNPIYDKTQNGVHSLQIYRGYAPEDKKIIQKYITQSAQRHDEYFVDGFGVKTLYRCVPFLNPKTLNLSLLKMPIPEDGFHAEAIEYVALTDAIQRFAKNRYCAVELGAGWGPWIGAAGVITRQQGIQDITLVGVEASPERSDLMRQHLEFNNLRPPNVTTEDATQGMIKTRLFTGAIWTTDGEIFFPESDVTDMGAAATNELDSQDYRGQDFKNQAVPCRRLETLLQDYGIVDFIHIDIQGAEFELIADQIDWICHNVRSLMVATHNRLIEGQLINLLLNRGWLLHREKPCKVDWTKPGTLTSKTVIDGSQYWINTAHLS